MSTSFRSRLCAGAAAWIFSGFACVALSGCTLPTDMVTGAISSKKTDQAPPSDPAALREYADRWGKAYDASPGEKVASMNYARALRALTRYDEAVAVMRVAGVKAPKDYEVLGAYGKALADAGELTMARDVLSRAYPMERPDWTIQSVQGSVEDRLGNYDAAQHFYTEALKIAPGEPTVLTNLGLSYALTKKLDDADKAMRQAADSPRADARVRQNFALVLALEGKFGEADTVSRQDMSEEDAKRNVQTIRKMIAQNDTWKGLQGKPGAKKVKPLEPEVDADAEPAG